MCVCGFVCVCVCVCVCVWSVSVCSYVCVSVCVCVGSYPPPFLTPENQLNYPERFEKERDFHLKWMQILTALVSDEVLFNSEYNRDSFLDAIDGAMRKIPDKAQRVAGLKDRIAPKCRVLYFPIDFPVEAMGAGAAAAADSARTAGAAAGAGAGAGAAAPAAPAPATHAGVDLDAAAASAATSLTDTPPSPSPPPPKRRPVAPLHICWNHRWEHDKAPDAFFLALRNLHDKGADFRVVVLGERFAETPPVFDEAKAWLDAAGKVAHWGYAESRADYLRLLSTCDVAVSTAEHEFFGVSMIEAAGAGCFVLCPRRLAYPELWGGGTGDHLYNTVPQLTKALLRHCRAPGAFRTTWRRRQPDELRALQQRVGWDAVAAGFRAALGVGEASASAPPVRDPEDGSGRPNPSAGAAVASDAGSDAAAATRT